MDIGPLIEALRSKLRGSKGSITASEALRDWGPCSDISSLEEERRWNTRGGKASESLSEENCPLEALRVFFFSRNSHRKTSERSS